MSAPPVPDDLDVLLRTLDGEPGHPWLEPALEALGALGEFGEADRRAKASGRYGPALALSVARGALTGMQRGKGTAILKRLQTTTADEVARRTLVTALIDDGELGDALEEAESFLVRYHGDPSMLAIREDLGGGPHPARGPDPLDTLDRVDALLKAGRPARALRILRRIQLSAPDDPDVLERLARIGPAVVPLLDMGLASVAGESGLIMPVPGLHREDA